MLACCACPPRRHPYRFRPNRFIPIPTLITALPAAPLPTNQSTRRAQLEPFLRTCGFRESAIQWLPAVGPSGENLAKPASDPQLAAWWKGPTLAQVRRSCCCWLLLLELVLLFPCRPAVRGGS